MNTRSQDIDDALKEAPQSDPIARVAEEFIEDDQSEGRFLLFNLMPSWVFSFLMHVALILIMAFLVLPTVEVPSVSFEASESVVDELETIELDLDVELDVDTESLESELSEEIIEIEDSITPELEIETDFEDFSDVDFDVDVFETTEEFTASEEIGVVNETLSRSSEQSREKLIKEYGGSAASEEAVALALKWIVKHQLPDGGWSFDHTIGDEKFRKTPNPGILTDFLGNRQRTYARNGATALALLPLLGQGHTHLTGKYKNTVRRGLEYLMQKGQPQSNGSVSYVEPGGTFYSHGLCSIVFSEAFAMSEDPLLAPFAQGCIWYLEQSQDPVGGGWRYASRAAGDTSVVGWQVMAIKSAKLAGLKINRGTFKGIDKFLNDVSIEDGTFYGYDKLPNRRDSALTSIGILCRMYMGWGKDHPAINKAVEFFGKKGPDVRATGNIYYNYYATQVMKQFGGPAWKKWNLVMRDSLVDSQKKEGLESGSWFFPNNAHGCSAKGGRLYCTAMACMTLEVYYRYLPLYSKEATEDDFPLD